MSKKSIQAIEAIEPIESRGSRESSEAITATTTSAPSIRAPKQQPVTMTESAIAHVTTEIAKHYPKECKNIGFRLHLSTAGCSGLMYKVAIVDEINPNDICFPGGDNFALYIDSKAYPYVQGTEIDYVSEGLNQVFKYKNPNETAACGCGESFTIDDRFDHEEEY